MEEEEDLENLVISPWSESGPGRRELHARSVLNPESAWGSTSFLYESSSSSETARLSCPSIWARQRALYASTSPPPRVQFVLQTPASMIDRDTVCSGAWRHYPSWGLGRAVGAACVQAGGAAISGWTRPCRPCRCRWRWRSEMSSRGGGRRADPGREVQ
jgi:hypothetical protein